MGYDRFRCEELGEITFQRGDKSELLKTEIDRMALSEQIQLY